MNRDRLFAELARESTAIISGMCDWQAAHPRATFAELEAAVDERLDGLRARMLGELALARTAAGGAELAARERPKCPACGERMVPRGTHTRQLTIQGDQTIPLTRSYWVCPACEAGLFPPG